ncbi:MAG: glycosyltransferase [Rubrivivax sp.]|nr:glycosyltransferase [Rubrivivax sp.]
MRWAMALAIAGLASLVNLGLWRLANPPLAAPDVPARVGGLAYNAFPRWGDPHTGRFPSDAQVDADLRQLAALTTQLRTYSAGELPALPALARRHGLQVSLGVWLDGRADANEREVSAAIDAARHHPNVKRIIAGNETQLHRTLSATELHTVLRRLRAATRVPVSTAEPWHVWVYRPELARHVDFITVHLLPYWEGVSVHEALEDALLRLRMVRERHPRKPIVIGEIGWPSGGDSVRSAHATPAAQAAFVRGFLARAGEFGGTLASEVYLMEAVDQPWKRATEGRVGAHWGLLDASRTPKFSFSGPLFDDPYWARKAALSSALGLATLLPFLLAFAHMRLAGRLAFAFTVQAVAAFAVLLGAVPLAHYLSLPDIALLGLLVPALALMAAMLLAQAFEFAETFWPGSLRRRLAPRPLAEGAAAPFVSVHLACSNENAEMVIATIDSLRALDWPAFEIIVIDNNTTDPACWRPVRAHVKALEAARRAQGGGGKRAIGGGIGPGPRIRWFRLPRWPGFKAGALNFALGRTDPRAAWVAVVDADYLVAPDWLHQLAGWLEDAAVGAVQSPQAHRDCAAPRLKRMMNWEFEGFFRIGMHHRHERDALVQHGTMTIVRRESLRRLGGWAEDCVCEDTELGLRLLQQGQSVVYVDKVLGTGLVPSDFAAFQRQRRRWAQGAMQILRAHLRALFGAGGRLTAGQRYHFVAGWLPWLGDALHLVFTIAAIAWTVGVIAAPQVFAPPMALFVVPLVVYLVARGVLGPLLYWRCVRCPGADIFGAAWAGMALSHAIARGVLAGLFGARAVFHVTRKGRPAPGRPHPPKPRPRTSVVARWRAWLEPVQEQTWLLLALWLAGIGLVLCPGPVDAPRAAWLLVLVLQSLPYAAAVACARLPSDTHPAVRSERPAGAAVARREAADVAAPGG